MLFCLVLTAPAKTELPLTPQSTPKLDVLLYSFPGLSPGVLHDTEAEAARLLRQIGIEPEWIDCTSRLISARCMASPSAIDLIVRFTAKALPQASTKALGIAGSSADYAAAFIFYDRVLVLRTSTRLLPMMLGRVLAHEIMHLLLPREEHSELGLMRGLWTVDDLRITSTACLGLPVRSVQLVPREAFRRFSARARIGK
jgi:hypothetical protein